MPRITTDDERDIAAPTIHLNGTSPAVLRDDAMRCVSALSDARKALTEAAPHRRDYYTDPSGPDAWKAADREFRLRLVMLDRMIGDYETIARHAQEAIDARTGPAWDKPHPPSNTSARF